MRPILRSPAIDLCQLCSSSPHGNNAQFLPWHVTTVKHTQRTRMRRVKQRGFISLVRTQRTIIIFFWRFYLRKREWERESTSRKDGQRQRRSRLFSEQGAHLGTRSWGPEIMTWAGGRRLTDRTTKPRGAPQTTISNRKILQMIFRGKCVCLRSKPQMKYPLLCY